MTVPDCLEGAYDLHVHSSPDVDQRRFDDIDLAREAKRAGMGGLLIKSHQNSTAERAWLVRKLVEGLDVFGGIVLNETVGGLNLAAVRLALQLGAKQVWMPTRSARNHRRAHNQDGGISVLDSGGDLVDEARLIVDTITGTGAVLGTGHLSPDEGFLLASYASLQRVPVIVTHPEWPATHYTLQEQRRMWSLGNVRFERCFVSTTHRCGHVPMTTISNAIADLGVDSTILSTDLGQPDTPPPAEGFRMYAEKLRAEGFSPDDLRRMMVDNPRRVLTGA